jgi:hypothetical protein
LTCLPNAIRRFGFRKKRMTLCSPSGPRHRVWRAAFLALPLFPPVLAVTLFAVMQRYY